MTDIRKLLQQIADQETQLRSTQFIAPCVKGGRVRTRVAAMVYTFAPKPCFEGWGIFQPLDEQSATLIEDAALPQIEIYLQQFPAVRLRLASRLQDQTWLAYPVNEADMRQRFKQAKPIPVHLVAEGATFEQIVARFHYQFCWFEAVDRRADLEAAAALQLAFKQLTPIEDLRFKNMTPEMRSTYELVTRRTQGLQLQQDEKRLRKALQMGGGELNSFQDRSDYWTVDWTTADGTRHSSAIAKTDLTVVSSGICLSGHDRDFDLQSLVGVMGGVE